MQSPLSNLIESYETSIKKHSENLLYGTKRNGKYEWITYAQFNEMTSSLRGGLAHHGLEEGDCVAIISDNCVEWAVIAYATLGLKAHYTPMYEKQLAKDWKFIIENSEAKFLFVADETIYETVKPWLDEMENLKEIFIIKAPESHANSFSALKKLGEENPAPNCTDVSPNQLAALVYTSGTTGQPKGVMLSHQNICTNINDIRSIFDIGPENRTMAFLPWAHVFGQTLELHLIFALGASVGFVESIDKIIDNFSEVQPTILVSVPRIFNRIYAKIQKKLTKESLIKRKLFEKAIANSQQLKDAMEKNGKAPIHLVLADKIFDKLIFQNIRNTFGGRLKFCFTGGASLSPEVTRFIDNLHIQIYEGYGLTETAPLSLCTSPGKQRAGSIGFPIPSCEIKLAPDEGYDEPNVGELCVKGPNVMLGYFKLPEKTKEVIEPEGWFHTGDLARIDNDGYVWVIGRVKEQYKLENGKYVVPAPLEEKLKLSPFINQCFIEGTNRRFNVAIITLDMEEVNEWAEKQGIAIDKDIFTNEKLNEVIKKEIDELGANFKGYEKPRKWILTDYEMTTDNGLLTPSLKVKRREVMKKYGNQIEELYKE